MVTLEPIASEQKPDKVIDVKRTRFGFRQWKWDSHMFTLNGVKWPMWADTNYTASPRQFMELCQTSNMNQMRYWRQGTWGGMTRRQVLDYFDETGMIVRSSGVFDGQGANYGGGLRVDYRDHAPPGESTNHTGFRCARDVD